MKKLSLYLRKKLSKPIGTLITEEQAIKHAIGANFIITVGDVISYTLLSNNIEPEIVVYDGKVGRKNADKKITERIKAYDVKKVTVINPAGHISSKLFWTFYETVGTGKTKIKINGEEDLAVLPAVLSAPEGTLVFYGQPNQGIVMLKVNKTLKKKIQEMYEGMIKISEEV